eukprot:m.466533 g.466533  ORF g.466533 m.466533 type:complete len:108 (-) comp25296_c0_seq1:610-933(-)
MCPCEGDWAAHVGVMLQRTRRTTNSPKLGPGTDYTPVTHSGTVTSIPSVHQNAIQIRAFSAQRHCGHFCYPRAAQKVYKHQEFATIREFGNRLISDCATVPEIDLRQ